MMKMFCGVVLIVGLLLSFGNATAEVAITIDIVPSSQNAAVGDSVDVELVISGLGAFEAPSLGTFDVDVTFNPAVLAFDGAIFGDQLDVLGLGANITEVTPGMMNVNIFKLSFDFPMDLDDLQPGSFTLATLTFDAIAPGTSTSTIVDGVLGDALGDSLAFDTGTGTVTVPPPSDKDPGHPYVDLDNDGRFTDGTDVPLTNGEVEDGTFDVRVSEGGYDAVAAGCDTDNCGLVIPASTGVISVRGFTYKADGDLVVDTDLTGTRPTTTSSLESRSGSVLLDDPTIAAPRNLSIKAANDIIATNGDTIQVDQTQGFLALEAGGNVDVSGSLVKGGCTFTLTAGGQIIATVATLENTDFNAGTTVLTTNGGPIKIDAATVRGGRQTIMTASGGIDASEADILITTGSSGPFVQLNSGGSIDVTDASITDSGGRSTIDLKADIDIDCTGSTLTADTVSVMAGGNATNCPQ